jgi:hypothetical protein
MIGSGLYQLQPKCPAHDTPGIFQLIATFRPTECPISRALYISRAVIRGHAPARDLSPLCDASWGGRESLFDVRSRPQHGTGYFRRRRRGPQARGGCWEMRRGQRAPLYLPAKRGRGEGGPKNQSASAMPKQSNRAGLLSVGLSTRLIRMQAACPRCNTSPSSRAPCAAVGATHIVAASGLRAPTSASCILHEGARRITDSISGACRDSGLRS